MPHRLVAALALASACFAENRILRPTDKSVLKPGAVSIIAAGAGELKLDGKPVPAKQPSPGVLTAAIQTTPGIHELSLGDQKVRFSLGGAPAGFKEFRAHPPAATCDTCHTVTDGAWAIKSESCFGCHEQKTFPKTHQHNTEVLAECQLCHMPHGSTEKGHMKMAKAVACKQCHG